MTETHAIAILNAAGQILVDGGGLKPEIRDEAQACLLRAFKAYEPFDEYGESSEDFDDPAYTD